MVIRKSFFVKAGLAAVFAYLCVFLMDMGQCSCAGALSLVLNSEKEDHRFRCIYPYGSFVVGPHGFNSDGYCRIKPPCGEGPGCSIDKRNIYTSDADADAWPCGALSAWGVRVSFPQVDSRQAFQVWGGKHNSPVLDKHFRTFGNMQHDLMRPI